MISKGDLGPSRSFTYHTHKYQFFNRIIDIREVIWLAKRGVIARARHKKILKAS